MKTMRYFYTLLLAATFVSACSSTRINPNEEEWITLFNGRDLNDWIVKITGYEAGDNFADTYRVEDGLLTVSYDGYDVFGNRYGNIFYKEPFSHYRITLEYRFVGDQVAEGPGWALRNSGIMVHSQSPQSMLVDQDFPISIEVQLLGGTGTGERTTANLCTPGTHVVMNGQLEERHCINSTSETFHGDQWVQAEVLVLGDSLIRHYVNGTPVLEYTSPQIGGGNVDPVDPAVKQDGKLLSEGYIALQSESHPVQFRNVRLLNLKGCMDPEAKNHKTYYVAHDEASCQY
jgi:hypothetical protein